MSQVEEAVIAVGGNVGDVAATIARAVALMAQLGEVRAVSPLYRSAPMYVTDQPAFLNGVVVLATRSWPGELLASLKEIEGELGRVARERNGPREIDLDLLDLGGLVLEREELTLPHPRMGERPFVLLPLHDVRPEWRHPVSDETAAKLLARLGPVDLPTRN